MDKWCVEMAYGIGFTVSQIEARSKEEAVMKAKELIDNTNILTDIFVDESGLEFEQLTYAGKEK